MDLFSFIHHVDPTKVRIGERQIEEGHVLLLDSNKGRVIPLIVRDDHGGQNDAIENRNEGSGGVGLENHSKGDDRAGQDDNIVVDDDVQAAVADKPKGTRKKRKAAIGASGSSLPPKKLREDHDTSMTTMPFVTSFVTLTPEREGGGHIDSVFKPNLRTQHQAERFVISSESSHHSSTNAADAEVTSIVRSAILTPPVMTADIAATLLLALLLLLFLGRVLSWLFRAFLQIPLLQVRSDRIPLVLLTLANVINDSALDDPETCLSAEVRLRSEHTFRERKKFERKYAKHTDLLKEKDAEIANSKSYLQLSFNELSIKAASLESQKDSLTDQVSVLETTCSGLHDQVSGYELFKEQYEVVQDEQVKMLNHRVVELNSELIGMEIGLAIDKEMHTGLVAGINHGKAKRGLDELESWKDACIADIMDSLCLDGPFAEILEVSRLQPAYEKLLLPIHRKEDNAIIRETSLSDSLNVVHDRVQKVKEGALSHRLFISEAMGPLLDPLSSKNLVGKASTSGVPATVAITTSLSVSVLTASVSSIPPISVADYKVLNTEPQAEASHYPKIIFEQKTLETSPEHPATSTGLARPLTYMS
nr:hypothetical protein [Tanacetum cinerariifolium]